MANGRCFPQRFDDAEKSECFKCCTAGGLREPCAWTTDSLSPAQSAWRGSQCLLQRPWGLCGAIWVEISSDICVHALRANLPLLPDGHCGGGAPATFFFRRMPSSAPTRFEGTPRHGDRRATCKSVRVCVCTLCVYTCCSAGVCVRVQLQARAHPADVQVPKARSQARRSALPRLEVLGRLPEGRGRWGRPAASRWARGLGC